MNIKQKVWTLGFPKKPKPKVPEQIKVEVGKICNEFVESFLKPQYIKPPPKDNDFNYVVDIYTKWRLNCFYFIAKYRCPGPNAVSLFFEDKFARIEYVDKDKFNLSYMRHTEQWFEIFTEISLKECIEAIKEMPHFMP